MFLQNSTEGVTPALEEHAVERARARAHRHTLTTPAPPLSLFPTNCLAESQTLVLNVVLSLEQ